MADVTFEDIVNAFLQGMAHMPPSPPAPSKIQYILETNPDLIVTNPQIRKEYEQLTGIPVSSIIQQEKSKTSPQFLPLEGGGTAGINMPQPYIQTVKSQILPFLYQEISPEVKQKMAETLSTKPENIKGMTWNEFVRIRPYLTALEAEKMREEALKWQQQKAQMLQELEQQKIKQKETKTKSGTAKPPEPALKISRAFTTINRAITKRDMLNTMDYGASQRALLDWANKTKKEELEHLVGPDNVDTLLNLLAASYSQSREDFTNLYTQMKNAIYPTQSSTPKQTTTLNQSSTPASSEPKQTTTPKDDYERELLKSLNDQ
ncbi:MAG: hypothetical protein ACP5JP_02285 [bacterium]